MSDQTLFSIFFSAMVVNNFTLAMFLGLCPFMGVSARVETALRMGLANIFVLVLTSLSAWVLNTFILESVPYLRIISFIIVVASLVQIVEMVVKKAFANPVPATWNLSAADDNQLRHFRIGHFSDQPGLWIFARDGLCCWCRAWPDTGAGVDGFDS